MKWFYKFGLAALYSVGIALGCEILFFLLICTAGILGALAGFIPFLFILFPITSVLIVLVFILFKTRHRFVADSEKILASIGVFLLAAYIAVHATVDVMNKGILPMLPSYFLPTDSPASPSFSSIAGSALPVVFLGRISQEQIEQDAVATGNLAECLGADPNDECAFTIVRASGNPANCALIPASSMWRNACTQEFAYDKSNSALSKSFSVSCSGTTSDNSNVYSATWSTNVSGGYPPYEYLWSTDNDVSVYEKGSDHSQSLTADYVSAGTKEANVRVFDSSGNVKDAYCSVTI